MSFPVESDLIQRLKAQESSGLHRSLKTTENLIDFCSNDYLGFARSEELHREVQEYANNHGLYQPGSTGSRLLTGNTDFAEELEAFIANYHNAEAGLIFNSGYDANIGIFSCVPQREDTVIYDEFIHASIRDGIRLGLARAFSFEHNSIEALEFKLKKAKGQVYIAIESVYSMDGDFSPLAEIVELSEKYNAKIIVDEAHATGIVGEGGKGRVVELGLEQKIMARMHTFGKALGCHGAVVLGTAELRCYLINFSRPFIYTTALPILSLISIKKAYDILSSCDNKILKTSILIDLYKQLIDGLIPTSKIESSTPIQCLILGENERVREASKSIQNEGFDVRPILSPTVPKGLERLRICLHAFNSEEEVKGLVNSIKRVI